jgi:hypothetical protein
MRSYGKKTNCMKIYRLVQFSSYIDWKMHLCWLFWYIIHQNRVMFSPPHLHLKLSHRTEFLTRGETRWFAMFSLQLRGPKMFAYNNREISKKPMHYVMKFHSYIFIKNWNNSSDIDVRRWSKIVAISISFIDGVVLFIQRNTYNSHTTVLFQYK